MKLSIPNIFLSLLFAFSSILQASDLSFAGNVKLFTSETLYSKNDFATIDNKRLQHNYTLSTRLMTSYKKNDLLFDLHYDLQSQHSTLTPSSTQNTNEIRQLIDLESYIVEKGNVIYENRIDRLSISYTKESLFFKFGRQAISWGNGFLFNPLDLINPYSQSTIDREYKSGTDMLYGQWITDKGNDWQWVIVPRRNIISKNVSDKDSSFIIKYKSINPLLDLDLLAARHYDETVLGIGLLKSINDTIWRLDSSITILQDNTVSTIIVTNMDYSWSFLNKNMYGYIEYMHNSLGINHYEDLNNSNIQKRIARAELFTVGRNYLAAGLTIETSPLTNISSNYILNLHDLSMLIPIAFHYNWKQDVNLSIGGTFTLGKSDTEYGGYKLLNGMSLSPGQTVYSQLSFYF